MKEFRELGCGIYVLALIPFMAGTLWAFGAPRDNALLVLGLPAAALALSILGYLTEQSWKRKRPGYVPPEPPPPQDGWRI